MGDASEVSMTRLGCRATLIAATVFVLEAVSVSAHHSFAPYEPKVQIKMIGAVTELRWTNPHVYIEMDVVDAAKGEKRHWLIECANPGILNRVGWRFNMVNQAIGSP
jgi:hypothetical protein